MHISDTFLCSPFLPGSLSNITLHSQLSSLFFALPSHPLWTITFSSQSLVLPSSFASRSSSFLSLFILCTDVFFSFSVSLCLFLCLYLSVSLCLFLCLYLSFVSRSLSFLLFADVLEFRQCFSVYTRCMYIYSEQKRRYPVPKRRNSDRANEDGQNQTNPGALFY